MADIFLIICTVVAFVILLVIGFYLLVYYRRASFCSGSFWRAGRSCCFPSMSQTTRVIRVRAGSTPVYACFLVNPSDVCVWNGRHKEEGRLC
jgi:hypothetical protein